MEVINALGRRKSAVARVYVSEGAGKITINGRDIETYFPSSILRYIVLQPLNKLEVAEKYDIKVNLDGGTSSSLVINGELVNNPPKAKSYGGRFVVTGWGLVP